MSPAGADGQRRKASARRRQRKRKAEEPAGQRPAQREVSRRAKRRRKPADDAPVKGRRAAPQRRPHRLRGGAGGFVDPRRQLAITGTITIIGLAMVGIEESFVGKVVTLLGCLAFMWAIHKYGRLGPEGG